MPLLRSEELRYCAQVCKLLHPPSCSGIKPYLEALSTVTDAFSGFESTQATLGQAVLYLVCVGNFLTIPNYCLEILETHPSAVQKLRTSAEFQRNLINCFRILERLPGQLSRLLTLPIGDSASMRADIYIALIKHVVGTARGLVSFLENRNKMKPAFALVPVEFSNFLVNAIDLSADLTAAAQALLNASIAGVIPVTCLPSTAAYYFLQVGSILSIYYQLSNKYGIDSGDYDTATNKVLDPGTWARPFFLGIDGLVKQWTEGEISLEKLEEYLNLGIFFFKRLLFCPREEVLERSSKSAAILASPAFQTDAKSNLIGYSAVVSTVLAPLENDESKSGRILDIYAYAAMAEATVLTAQANASYPNWKQLASNIIDLGNAWMRLNGVKYAKEAATLLFLAIERKFSNIAYFLIILRKSCEKGTNGFDLDRYCAPSDVVVELTTAVERLLALVGSCANLYMLPAQHPPSPQIYCPVQPALDVACLLAKMCGRSIPSFRSEACGTMWKRAMEESFGALETGAKTASLLFNSLTPKQRELLLKLDPVVDADDISRFNQCFAQVLFTQMFQFTCFASVALVSGRSDESKLFMASGFLTFTQACAMLGSAVQGSWEMRVDFLPDVLDYTQGVLEECFLTSDVTGISYLHSAAEIEPGGLEEEQKESLTALKNILETYIPNIDDTDPARLKLRAQVLGLRGCANIKCTTLRPSSKKSFSKLCAGCQSVRYCGAQCQKADWKGNHKGACKQFQEERSLP